MDAIPLTQAVTEFKISESTLYRMIRAGELTRYRRRGDRRTFVDREQLQAVLAFRVNGEKGATE